MNSKKILDSIDVLINKLTTKRKGAISRIDFLQDLYAMKRCVEEEFRDLLLENKPEQFNHPPLKDSGGRTTFYKRNRNYT